MNNLPIQYNPEQVLEDYWQGRDNVQPLGNNLPANFDGYGTPPARRDVPVSTVDYNKLAKGVGGLAAGAGVLAVGISAVKAMALAVYATIMANPGTFTIAFAGGAFLLCWSACRSGGEDAPKATGGGQYTNNINITIVNGNQQQ